MYQGRKEQSPESEVEVAPQHEELFDHLSIEKCLNVLKAFQHGSDPEARLDNRPGADRR